MSIPEGAFDGIFKAKLRDNGIEYSDDNYRSFCAQISRSFLKGILDLSRQRIGINTLTKLTKVLRTSPFIRVFNFYGNLIRDHGLQSLLQLLIANPQVEVVDIGCNDLTNRSIACLVDIIKTTNVRSLQLGSLGAGWHNNKFQLSSVSEILSAVHATGRIECLGLHGMKMSERQGSRRMSIAQELADFIANNQVLRSLALGDNGFTLKEEDVVTVQGLLMNERIRFLDFRNNNLIDPVGPNFLGQMGRMTNLMYLDLRGCQLSPAAGKALAEMLAAPNKLIVLNIADNDIRDEGLAALLDTLVYNDRITELNFAGNRITEQSAALIGDYIRRNPIIYQLNMSRNALGDEGALAIAAGLPENESIVVLDISSCRIADKGAVAIAKSLENNSTLKQLKMRDNFLSRECGYRIVEHVRHNEHIFLLDVTSSQINHFVIKAIRELCERNVQIQKEVFLQPLKKELVQLSIQRTKMPEAESRLQSLEQERDNMEREVLRTEEDIESTQANADANIRLLRKQIQSTKDAITEEHKAIEKIGVDQEKMIKEYDTKFTEINADMEKEKALLEGLEKETQSAEADLEMNTETSEKQITEMKEQLEQLRTLIKETKEIGLDPERLRDYEAPQLPMFMEPTKDKFFLNDEVMDLKEKEDKKRKKKKGKKKKRPASSKRARKQSPEQEPEVEAMPPVDEPGFDYLDAEAEGPAPAQKPVLKKRSPSRIKSQQGKRPVSARRKRVSS